MGTVGLYDCDLSNFGQIFFNLELMKLASYFKNSNQIVTMCPKIQPELYSDFYYRKDYDTGVFNKKILPYLSNEHFHYGGLAFSNNKYIPLPEDIEGSIPDPSIYSRFQESFERSSLGKIGYRSFMRGPHLRLSIDEKTISNYPFDKVLWSTKGVIVFIHDYDIGKIENSLDTVKYLLQQKNKNLIKGALATKFPVVLKKEQDFIEWEKIIWSPLSAPLTFKGLMDDEAFSEVTLLTRLGQRKIENIDYYIDYGCSDEDDFIINRLPKIFKQVTFLRMNQARIFLKYEDNFFQDERCRKLIGLLNVFIEGERTLNYEQHNDFINTNTFAGYCKKLQIVQGKPKVVPFLREDAREVFQFIREKNYELFKDFYECSTVTLKNGEFKNDK